MLPPDSRAVLRELLRPPAGTRLKQAVGTTFTVDLVSALVVPVSFAARDLGEQPDPIGVMEAVRACVDRVDVFYQAGHALVPQQASDLMAFLEPMLHAVRAPRPGRLFHPKIWLLKYIDSDDEISYRLICSTRNLTADRSWDAVISLDGWAGTRRDPGNEPIRQFVNALPALSTPTVTPERLTRIHALAEEIRRAEWEGPEDASAVVFHALGLTRRNELPDFSGYRRLVVSPFIDDAGLAIVAPPTERGTVIVARPEHLNQLTSLTSDIDVRALSVLGDIGEESTTSDLGGLHAKITIVERNRSAYMFVGSANATHAAYDGNVEFLVEIVRGAAKYGVDAHLSPESGFGALLEEYVPQPHESDLEAERRFQLRDLLRRIAELPWTVTVDRSSEANNLSVDSNKPLPSTDAALVLELLTRRGETSKLVAGAAVTAGFTSVIPADITPFLVVIATADGVSESTVIPAALVGDPAGRLDAVLARQVDTPEKFLRFLLLLLGLDSQGQFAGEGSGGLGAWTGGSASQGLFELLARALADQPASLEDLDRLVQRLRATEAGRSVMPEGFEALWRVIAEARVMIGAQR